MEISDIKAKLTLSEVIKHYGYKADKQNRINCPFHEDKTPSMQLYWKTHTASFRSKSPVLQRFPGDVSTPCNERRRGTRRAMETNYFYIMPIKTNIPHDSGHFFITFTCYNWLPLFEMYIPMMIQFEITNSYDLVYNWFNLLKENGHQITGYVIMPNHVHAIIAFRKIKKNINKIIGDGKRFISYEMVKRLKEKNETALLDKLASAVNKSDRAKGKLFEIWEDKL